MKIKEIELLSKNLAEALKFYSEVLNFETLESSDEKISLKAGDSILTFKKTSAENPVYHFAFDIPNNKLEESLQWLSQRVDLIEFQGSPVIDFPNWGAKSLYFHDNSGNVLEFIARFENDNKNFTEFDSSSIVSISEIAFVTNEVINLATDIKENHGLSYFERQIPHEDFSVIGDDNGLFILVKSSRNWYPTSVKVQIFPIKVIYENAGNISQIDYK